MDSNIQESQPGGLTAQPGEEAGERVIFWMKQVSYPRKLKTLDSLPKPEAGGGKGVISVTLTSPVALQSRSTSFRFTAPFPPSFSLGRSFREHFLFWFSPHLCEKLPISTAQVLGQVHEVERCHCTWLVFPKRRCLWTKTEIFFQWNQPRTDPTLYIFHNSLVLSIYEAVTYMKMLF